MGTLKKITRLFLNNKKKTPTKFYKHLFSVTQNVEV